MKFKIEFSSRHGQTLEIREMATCLSQCLLVLVGVAGLALCRHHQIALKECKDGLFAAQAELSTQLIFQRHEAAVHQADSDRQTVGKMALFICACDFSYRFTGSVSDMLCRKPCTNPAFRHARRRRSGSVHTKCVWRRLRRLGARKNFLNCHRQR